MKTKHVYGPVPSRRLGLSIGIDLVPFKHCTFDCIYCQIGTTTRKTCERKEYVPASEIIEEITQVLRNNPRTDYLTFSGSGEPTLHSRIGYLIQKLKIVTEIPVAVLTNGSLLFRQKVREDIAHADVVLPTLCAVSDEVFRNINRSHPEITIGKIISGLVAFRKMYSGMIWLEVMLVKNVNDSDSDINNLKETIDEINPDIIHLNTIVRPPSEVWAAPLSLHKLKKIQAVLGNKCEIIVDFKNQKTSNQSAKKPSDILDIIKRRPVTVRDIVNATGLHQLSVLKHLEELQRHHMITSAQHDNKIYYEAVQQEET